MNLYPRRLRVSMKRGSEGSSARTRRSRLMNLFNPWLRSTNTPSGHSLLCNSARVTSAGALSKLFAAPMADDSRRLNMWGETGGLSHLVGSRKGCYIVPSAETCEPHQTSHHCAYVPPKECKSHTEPNRARL